MANGSYFISHREFTGKIKSVHSRLYIHERLKKEKSKFVKYSIMSYIKSRQCKYKYEVQNRKKNDILKGCFYCLLYFDIYIEHL